VQGSCRFTSLPDILLARRPGKGIGRKLEAIRPPVFARAVLSQGPFKDAAGAINVPVSCGGVAVRPADIILGDADGWW